MKPWNSHVKRSLRSVNEWKLSYGRRFGRIFLRKMTDVHSCPVMKLSSSRAESISIGNDGKSISNWISSGPETHQPARWDSSLRNYLFSDRKTLHPSPWMLHVRKIIIVRVDGCVWHAEGFSDLFQRNEVSEFHLRNPIIRTHLKQLFVLTISGESREAVTANSDKCGSYSVPTYVHHLHTK